MRTVNWQVIYAIYTHIYIYIFIYTYVDARCVYTYTLYVFSSVYLYIIWTWFHHFIATYPKWRLQYQVVILNPHIVVVAALEVILGAIWLMTSSPLWYIIVIPRNATRWESWIWTMLVYGAWYGDFSLKDRFTTMLLPDCFLEDVDKHGKNHKGHPSTFAYSVTFLRKKQLFLCATGMLAICWHFEPWTGFLWNCQGLCKI